jgi:signal transduction histidine kinase
MPAGIDQAASADPEPHGSNQLALLVGAGIALTSQLSLDALLNRLLELSAQLTGARYAALGVVENDGCRLQRFVTYGLAAEEKQAIGEPPRGRGVLGALIGELAPLRLPDLAADPRSVGFPPHHPPMRSFLGVPIVLRGVPYGNLYLTEKRGADSFTADDEHLAGLLAAQAAVAIENARLYEAAVSWSSRLESLEEIGVALAAETRLDALLDLIARRLRAILDARIVTVLLPSGANALRFAAVAGDAFDELIGSVVPRSNSKSGRVLAAMRSERIDSVIDDQEVDLTVRRRIGATTGLWIPLLARGEPIGVLAVHDKQSAADLCFSDDDLRLAESFANRAALAVDLSERIARDSLQRVVDAQELERRRLARELHEETAQALASIMLGLRGIEAAGDVDSARRIADDLRPLATDTLKNVRRLAADLHPKALEDFGLEPAVERLAESWQSRTGIEISVSSRLGSQPLTGPVATTLYRIVQEALLNIVKHGRARRVDIVLKRHNEEVTVVIEHDGREFEQQQKRDSALQGMGDRAALAGGLLRSEAQPGKGTRLTVELPLT